MLARPITFRCGHAQTLLQLVEPPMSARRMTMMALGFAALGMTVHCLRDSRHVEIGGDVRDGAGRPIQGFRIEYAVLRSGLFLPRVGTQGAVVTDANGRYRIGIDVGIATTTVDITPDDRPCHVAPYPIMLEVDRYDATPPSVDFRCTATPGR